ncbi:hypothetical protein SAMN04488558_11520 [Ignavigranum ruoffiae]|uniref:Polymerase/histidinol phosphatase N-terminal domain-containing protein n=1 Tax=Ignavigranum ruoffiae TaxID=89093 RepID=A0A1H9GLR2_9LACT|nr:CehA/McbA family metallohydrolase [Ignavigranum ruoffiae]SEQ51031.1 hypothetical protein SAMN04488558_11520 [Ignavigranum ruoffiae]
MKYIEKITYFVSHDQEGEYIKIPFFIKNDIEKITISYDYLKVSKEIQDDKILEENVSIIDFSIQGPNQQYLGSSGSNRSSLFFSQNQSSVGFINPKVMMGEWNIILGAYKVPLDGLNVTYEFIQESKVRRLLKGDTHTHSTASDGKLPLHLLVDVAKNIGLDYLIITDHNNFNNQTESFSTNDFTLIPGVEWTRYQGHGNFWGINQPFSGSFDTESFQDTSDFIKSGQSKGAKFIINHPFCVDCPWLSGLDLPFDAIEVWNGGTHLQSNFEAQLWWHEQLMKGRKISVTGGSDFHSFELFRMLGCPTTNIYSYSYNQKDILEALIKGNSFITYTVNGPEIDFEQSNVICGETYPLETMVHLYFTHLKNGQKIIIILEDQKIEYIVQTNEVSKNIYFNSGSSKFMRIEIYGSIVNQEIISNQLPILISNPIYFESEEKEYV